MGTRAEPVQCWPPLLVSLQRCFVIAKTCLEPHCSLVSSYPNPPVPPYVMDLRSALQSEGSLLPSSFTSISPSESLGTSDLILVCFSGPVNCQNMYLGDMGEVFIDYLISWVSATFSCFFMCLVVFVESGHYRWHIKAAFSPLRIIIAVLLICLCFCLGVSSTRSGESMSSVVCDRCYLCLWSFAF